jgi:L-iditol 2-dehydrogenase
MKIAILETPGHFRIKEQPIPRIEPDEVLVRVAACGVCTSDLHLWQEGGSNLPRALGHEVSGIVEQVGADANSFEPGDRVAVWATGKGYANYVPVKAEHCLSAGTVALDLALAEPLACAVNAVELADVSLGDDVVIIGAGFMGNLVQKLVALRGPRHVIVADTRGDALERASRLGATRVVNPQTESLESVVKELTGGRRADVTFEVTGTQPALGEAGNVTRMSGTIAIVGYHQGANREIPFGYWNWMAFKIANAHFREVATIMRGMEIGMRLLTSGRITLDDVVTHRFPLSEINEAFETVVAKPPGFTKATVIVDENLCSGGGNGA